MSTDADLRFLVVDDFETMRRIIRALLREIGYPQIDEAEDGAMALAMLNKAPYDFVISDLNMPVMDGFELLAQIKQSESLKHLPVLLVTAEARKQDIVRAAQLGASGYVVKPFTRATLEEKLAKILQRVAAAA